MIALRADRVKTDVYTNVKTPIDYQFLALPAEVARRRDVSSAAKLLLAAVMDSARGNRSGSSKLTNASLAARIGCSASTVKRLLAELEALGLVRRDTLAEKRVRTAIVPTWVDQERSTEQASVDQERSTGGTELRHPMGQERSTFQSLSSEPIQTGPILSTLGGADLDPKPGPAEIAKAMRAMIAGEYSSALFDLPEPTPEGPEVPPLPTPKPPTPPTPNPLPTPPKGAHSARPPRPPAPNVEAMARRVGYSAVAAIVQAKPARKTAAQQLAELAAWRRRTEAQECPGRGSLLGALPQS